MKYLTFAVPSYNAQDYLERCISSLLPGGKDVEIIIINDGSTDNTGAIADLYAEKYPDIVKVIHKINGGHGSGVNAGIKAATGVYYKVVDADDWVDKSSYATLLKKIKTCVDQDQTIDLFISNYVFNRLSEGTTKSMHFRNVLTPNKVSSWEDVKYFTLSQYLMMHSLTYRTEILRESGLLLPEHTFYVDNIFAFNPLPYVKKMIYIDVDFYQYLIGREDQSVNESSMIKRIDQQFLVTNTLFKGFHLNKVEKIHPKLARYMVRKLAIMMSITSIITELADTKEARMKLKKTWEDIKKKDRKLYRQIISYPLNAYYILPEPIRGKVAVFFYRCAKKIYKFS